MQQTVRSVDPFAFKASDETSIRSLYAQNPLILQRMTILNLSCSAISCIDLIPSHFPNLKSLMLAGNQITHVPNTIQSLQSMEYLELGSDCYGGNLIDRLPNEIGKCRSLRSLNISHNLITHLPDCLSQCPRLTELCASHNRLRSLPGNIGDWAALKSINVSHNRLEGLPSGLAALDQLQAIDISFNHIHSIKRSLLSFIVRRSFLICGNPFDNFKAVNVDEVAAGVGVGGKVKIHSLSELCLRAIPAADEYNECVHVMEMLTAGKAVERCTICKCKFYDDFHSEVMADFEFGLSADVKCSYPICSTRCLKQCKLMQQLEW